MACTQIALTVSEVTAAQFDLRNSYSDDRANGNLCHAAIVKDASTDNAFSTGIWLLTPSM